ncbi:MAG: GIY-YIG nuclease family protein [Candidatus Andersenbacteria bacterium]
MPVHFVYVVRCSDGSLYTGWTVDVPKRVAQHNAGTGAKYTRSRLPVTLVYVQPCPSKKAALHRERQIKALSRQEKLTLMRSGIP